MALFRLLFRQREKETALRPLVFRTLNRIFSFEVLLWLPTTPAHICIDTHAHNYSLRKNGVYMEWLSLAAKHV